MWFSKACLAPFHILEAFTSIPTKFLPGNKPASPTVYSPLPQASSRVMGFLLPNTSECHLPFNWSRASNVFGKDSYSPNFLSLFFAIKRQQKYFFFRSFG